MAPICSPYSSLFTFFIIVSILCIRPAHAFGAGNVPENSNLEGWVWKHGDIEDVLALVPVSFLTRYGFTKLDILRVYFGNWLRDYSQVIEIMPLSKIKEPTLRVIVSVLGFMRFGIATDEFDITKKRLGCYRPEEHIDNPRGYATDPAENNKYIGDEKVAALDPRLRRNVKPIEIEIDPVTGMKNYIANEKIGIATSAGYIRQKLEECIKCGRSGRNNNDVDRKEAFIHLGALLHTIEDFSAHSNYIELALQCIGEKGVFPYVGDQCKIPVPGTNEMVPPLVTGTFGALDIFQSIIGEVDDKAAIKNQGVLSSLDNKLGSISNNHFTESAAQVAAALKFIVQFIPGAKEMPNELANTIKTVTAVKKDPSKYDPGKVDVSEGTNELWAAIEPVFEFHGKFKRFLIEYEKELEVPYISAAKKKLDEAIEELVYSALAIIIEPAVKEVREAIKFGKETIEKVDRQNMTYIDIFVDGSKESDPSHSILAKDHFSNYLNPIAGRVATATTNWTTQRIVECWDSDDPSLIASNIESILSIPHHPAFALASPSKGTFIQKTMYSIIEDWWKQRSPEQLSTLRNSLSKDGIHKNADGHNHEDNNPVLDASYFTGSKGFAVDWVGAKPDLKPQPEKSLADGVGKLIEQAAKAVETAAEQIQQSVKQADELIDQGINAAVSVVDKTASDVAEGVVNGLVKQVAGDAQITPEMIAQAQRAAQIVLEQKKREAEEIFRQTQRAAEEAFAQKQREANELLERTKREAANAFEQANNFADQTYEKVKFW